MKIVRKNIIKYKKLQAIYALSAVLLLLVGVVLGYPQHRNYDSDMLSSLSQSYEDIRLIKTTTDLEHRMKTSIIEVYEAILDLKKGYDRLFGRMILIACGGAAFFAMLNAINCYRFNKILQDMDE